MPLTLDVHPLKSRIGDFVAGLKALEKEPITSAKVLEYLTQMQPSADAVSPYVFWSRDRYTRNLIYRDDFFEALAVCWLPGQRTPIHTHDGQLGWVTVVQGELMSRDYRFIRPRVSENGLTPKRSDFGEPRPVDVELLGSVECRADGRVAIVDRRQTTHQIENLERSNAGSISLHVYSKPIMSCVLFDEGTRCCKRHELRYHSINGQVVEVIPSGSGQVTEAA